MLRLQKFIDEKVPVTTLKSGSLALRHSTGRILISNPAGQLTKLGKAFYKKSGEEQPHSGYDLQQTLVREHDKEYIIFKNGKRKLARTYHPEENDFKYTRIGRSFVAKRKSLDEYILQIPVKVIGTNKKTGAKYERNGFLPHVALGLGELKVDSDLSEEEKEKQLKQLVQEQITPDNILTVSDEVYQLSDAAWKISKLQTKIADDGDIVTTAILDRALSDGKPYSFSHLWKPDAFHPSAFHETENCVPHQLSQALDLSEAMVSERLRDISAEIYGRFKGFTGAVILEWCKQTGRSCRIL